MLGARSTRMIGSGLDSRRVTFSAHKIFGPRWTWRSGNWRAYRRRTCVSYPGLYPAPPQIQIVVSDGLNANAVNENLRSVLPGVRSELLAAGHHVSETDIVIENGRVRAGYHIGSLLDAEMIIHLIGERPGTGINTLSAYLTYGLDEKGHSRWGSPSAPRFDHSWTTAVCGIIDVAKLLKERGRKARLVDRMLRSVSVSLFKAPRPQGSTNIEGNHVLTLIRWRFATAPGIKPPTFAIKF